MTDITTTIAEIEAALEGVTPGKWETYHNDYSICAVEVGHVASAEATEDARYIVATQPDNMRLLLAYVRAIEAENDQMAGLLDDNSAALKRAAGERDELRKALKDAADKLESLSYIHDGNPSDARAEMEPIDYARHMLFEARQMAREAHTEARATLATMEKTDEHNG